MEFLGLLFIDGSKDIKKEGLEGLKGHSKRPTKFAKLKVNADIENLILTIRNEFKFGPQRISTHLKRIHKVDLSPTTVWRVLMHNSMPKIKKYRKHEQFKRYSKVVPGERVQIDVTKIGPKCYQFTAVDDCARLRAIKMYPNKKAESAVDFLGYMMDTLEFPIQRVQTDWGTEFFNRIFQEELMEHFIKFRPIKPRSPHLNGKVERSQLTDKSEFYSTIPRDQKNMQLAPKLLKWQTFYNQKRRHASLNGMTPYEKYLELESRIPIQPNVTGKYWEKDVQILPRHSGWYYRNR
ncbi:MAG: IS481 family transposase [Flavisolibacter sp.]